MEHRSEGKKQEQSRADRRLLTPIPRTEIVFPAFEHACLR